jgi:hypothetical protein
MKKRLLFAAALIIALVLPMSRKAGAEIMDGQCYDENYGGGQCGNTCVFFNDQGSVEGYCTTFYLC